MATQAVTRIMDHGNAVRQVRDTDVLYTMGEEVQACNVVKGWYEDKRTFGDDIALLHSEVSEMLESFRDGGVGDQTKHDRPEETMCPMDMTCTQHKPEGVGSEAADVLVRLLDTCSRYEIDLFAEWRRKVDFNWTRPIRHGGKKL